MKATLLPDRGGVKVTGETARDFLNGLITSDTTRLQPGLGRFGALLTPQGKITVDFLITEAPAGKLKFYRLRPKIDVENLSDSLGVLAAWDGEAALKPDLTFTNPRNPQLGLRIFVPAELAQKAADAIGAELVDSSVYDAHRIAVGVPRGGLDFMYGDAFPHETNMDRLAGVGFDKGFYVRQEVVSRMQH